MIHAMRHTIAESMRCSFELIAMLILAAMFACVGDCQMHRRRDRQRGRRRHNYQNTPGHSYPMQSRRPARSQRIGRSLSTDQVHRCCDRSRCQCRSP
ncbi:hypothetical protein K227x_64020 [Rubripirellula lacrimiformis]|uniref:Uncharacterized protein n=1 Tax=Rubripirellula lacrimiformis TaxID=1930273 RepID=A0A517NLG9_9BACT|nr:hypothetical protein K227x_64020 [Rubripirellula lacrimiformis]